MEQHPIPQNISAYEFRLVGDMTLKQFFQLAGGIAIGLVIYRLPLPDVLKYPLIFLAVAFGITLAFIPINGRPFSRWITAFIRAIYAPTEFFWQASPLPSFPAVAATTPPAISTPASPPVTTPLPIVPAIIPDTAVSSSPVPVIAPDSTQTELIQVSSPPAAAPTDTPSVTAPTAPETASPPSTTVFTSFAAPPPSFSLTDQPSPAPPPQIPPLAPARPATPVTPTPPAAVTTQIAPPSLPNILTGLITTSSGSPLESAIVEIIDSGSGIPARALRTNRLGQFQIATPLSPGSYSIETEKDGYTFDPVSVSVANHIIPPVIISAKTV